MLEPRKSKYAKQLRGKMRGSAQAGNKIDFGDFGLQAKDCAWVSARQIESARRAVTGYIKRKGKLWIRIFPDKPITKKPPEVRGGKGKGDVEAHVAVIKPGRILFELGGVDETTAREAFRLASHKLCIDTRFLTKEGLL